MLITIKSGISKNLELLQLKNLLLQNSLSVLPLIMMCHCYRLVLMLGIPSNAGHIESAWDYGVFASGLKSKNN
ncbi:hypothetical protein BBW65_06060 [Helicobacter enhydrae]|uniref:Uncharacterized protein n=1 Tax=Helicobacter enhydrae TaxID=222136 RepID=A0A1B1U6S6_9HELI|nr:hypothetical protein [Helicobacter enhydrae]ANV98385.1 hypothetical protein BBW65_06060 [Helicobacter enhydrae]